MGAFSRPGSSRRFYAAVHWVETARGDWVLRGEMLIVQPAAIFGCFAFQICAAHVRLHCDAIGEDYMFSGKTYLNAIHKTGCHPIDC